ncbi:hypothetical protein [Phenylobacterium sp.]|uniref:hypothetical protein n=1 Tax=Phenylobacterium sp. TaxID=1871053 RepID=UPI0035B09208
MSGPDDLREMTAHLAARAREEFCPEAYAVHGAPGYADDITRYLRAAGWEHAHLAGLLADAARASGEWLPMAPGSLNELSSQLGWAIKWASEALAAGEVVHVAQAFTAVALHWAELRRRNAEVDRLAGDVQRSATLAGEAAAEAELRALAQAGERPVGNLWREEAQRKHTLTERGARRVWDAVATDYPALSSAAGKPKTRRAKA